MYSGNCGSSKKGRPRDVFGADKRLRAQSWNQRVRPGFTGLTRIQTVQVLQTVMGNGEKAISRKKRDRGTVGKEATQKSKSAASKEKSAALTNLLKNLLTTRKNGGGTAKKGALVS